MYSSMANHSRAKARFLVSLSDALDTGDLRDRSIHEVKTEVDTMAALNAYYLGTPAETFQDGSRARSFNESAMQERLRISLDMAPDDRELRLSRDSTVESGDNSMASSADSCARRDAGEACHQQSWRGMENLDPECATWIIGMSIRSRMAALS